MTKAHFLNANALGNPADLPNILNMFIDAGIFVSDPKGLIHTASGRGPYSLAKVGPKNLIVELRGRKYTIDWNALDQPPQQLHKFMAAMHSLVYENSPIPEWMLPCDISSN